MVPFLCALALRADTLLREDFERHIRFLASDEMRGRDNGTEEGRRAARYVADRLKDAGLKPGGRDGYFHDFVAHRGASGEGGDCAGRNVIGLLEGEVSGEFVVVAAHHDARGVIGGKIQNGADDNASGVAMVLELAQAFVRSKPLRSMLFISFDCEEDGLLGSREFVKSGLYDPGAFAAAFVFDLIGGDLLPWEKDRIYALGAEHSAELQERLDRGAAGTRDLKVARAGIYLIEPYPGLARSDYDSFRARGVPFVFLSTGTPWYYHTEHDDPGVLNFAKIEKAGRFAYRVIAETVAAPERPTFRRPAATREDAKLIREALEEAIRRKDGVKMTGAQLEAARGFAREIAAQEAADPKVLQRAMMFLFTVARAQGPR